MGWLIDPKEQTVLVYLPEQQVQIIDGADAEILVPDFSNQFSLTITELFGWLLA